ncbi:MAG: hypothetical protein V1494_03690 [Candidatus Diapherotrites archaeon]
MALKRKKEGRALGETADMKNWRKQFEKMSIDEHDEKLRLLGLDDEDIEEFNEDFSKGGSKKKLIDLVAEEK